MINEIIFFSLSYCLLTFLIIYPPDEAVSAGLTVETIIGGFLGSETLFFVKYHILRTTANIVAHSLLIPGYVLLLNWTNPWIINYLSDIHTLCFGGLLASSFLPFFIACLVVWVWSRDGWKRHPFSKQLALYTNNGGSESNRWTWKSLASDINVEFRRVDKFSTKLNNVSRIVVTDNWLIKLTSYSIRAIPLRDALLFLESSYDTTVITSDSSRSPSQFLLIRVSSVQREDSSFYFRLNSFSLKELQRKLVNPIVNSNRIVIHETLADRFVISFEETIKKNPKIKYAGELDSCIGCMSSPSSVKLERRCKDGNSGSDCDICSCRPMWCISCLSKWFASRQDEKQPNTWLSSRAPCPSCRSKFCLLDVCVIDSSNS